MRERHRADYRALTGFWQWVRPNGDTGPVGEVNPGGCSRRVDIAAVRSRGICPVDRDVRECGVREGRLSRTTHIVGLEHDAVVGRIFDVEVADLDARKYISG